MCKRTPAWVRFGLLYDKWDTNKSHEMIIQVYAWHYAVQAVAEQNTWGLRFKCFAGALLSLPSPSPFVHPFSSSPPLIPSLPLALSTGAGYHPRKIFEITRERRWVLAHFTRTIQFCDTPSFVPVHFEISSEYVHQAAAVPVVAWFDINC